MSRPGTPVSAARPFGRLGDTILAPHDVLGPLVETGGAVLDEFLVVKTFRIHTWQIAWASAGSVPGRGAIHLPPSSAAVWL